jgi:hypothetical protein
MSAAGVSQGPKGASPRDCLGRRVGAESNETVQRGQA